MPVRRSSTDPHLPLRDASIPLGMLASRGHSTEDLMTKVFKKAACDIMVGELVDLQSCPFLVGSPIARSEYAVVAHIERETPTTVVIGYEGIDHVGYPADRVLTVKPARIYLIPKTLTVCDTPDGDPVIGFVDPASGVAIVDANLSSCSRFQVEPQSYGISLEDVLALKELNEAAQAAAEAALDAMCAPLQEHLQVATGDFAGLYFSASQRCRDVLRTAMEYAVDQIERSKTELVDSEEGEGRA